jgi:HEAT repeat protein
MTAAQALGHTKDADAVKPLLGAVADGNEVVACTALTGLEEIHGGEGSSGFPGFSGASSSKGTFPAEMVSVLKTALGDSRWRVRATAVEVIGKLQVKELTGEVKKLLDDPDGFVVKNVLAALQNDGQPAGAGAAGRAGEAAAGPARRGPCA